MKNGNFVSGSRLLVVVDPLSPGSTWVRSRGEIGCADPLWMARLAMKLLRPSVTRKLMGRDSLAGDQRGIELAGGIGEVNEGQTRAEREPGRQLQVSSDSMFSALD